MCGIFGAVNLSGSFNSSDSKRFKELTDMVSYRGPDNHGYFSYNYRDKSESSENFNIFLGHRRLSIIDLSADGNQPFCVDGLTIIFNGEIFNYIELSRELQEYKFISKTDTEVILRIYQKYGEEGFSKLNGMWSFVMYDSKANKVIVSRDRFSIKPLYYLKKNDAYYFASEIKQLLPLLDQKKINKDPMFKHLRQGLVDYDDNTFFEGIYKVPQKSNFIINLNDASVKIKKYWDYQIPEIKNEADAIEQFRELFTDSILIRLRSDVKCGGLLSGGLDSSAICAIADKISNKTFDTYSIVSQDKQYSEEEFIDHLVGVNKIPNTKLMFDSNSIKDNLDTVIDHQGEPFGSFSIVAHYTLLKLIKENTDSKVILTGQGGDELLLGYLKYYFFNLKLLFRDGGYFQLFRELFYSLLYGTVLKQFKINTAKRYFGNNNIAEIPFLRFNSTLEPIWKVKDMKQRQILDVDKYSIPNLMRYDDRNSMAHSIETRAPFLDHRLVNFCLGVETNLKIKDGWMKYLLRKSITEMPHRIAWRRDKKNFAIPELQWIKKDLADEIISVMNNSTLHEYGLIDKKAFLQFYESFRKGNSFINFTDISKVYIAELWSRKYIS